MTTCSFYTASILTGKAALNECKKCNGNKETCALLRPIEKHKPKKNKLVHQFIGTYNDWCAIRVKHKFDYILIINEV